MGIHNEREFGTDQCPRGLGCGERRRPAGRAAGDGRTDGDGEAHRSHCYPGRHRGMGSLNDAEGTAMEGGIGKAYIHAHGRQRCYGPMAGLLAAKDTGTQPIITVDGRLGKARLHRTFHGRNIQNTTIAEPRGRPVTQKPTEQ